MDKESPTYMAYELLPPKANWEANSTRRLSRIALQKAMTKIKRFVEHRLESDLNVFEHTAPIAFQSGTGVNDELDGSESKSPVRFTVPNQFIPRGLKSKPTTDLTAEEKMNLNQYSMECEVMQSLGKRCISWTIISIVLAIAANTQLFNHSTSQVEAHHA
jgi:hypothetical protein